MEWQNAASSPHIEQDDVSCKPLVQRLTLASHGPSRLVKQRLCLQGLLGRPLSGLRIASGAGLAEPLAKACAGPVPQPCP